jgi:hypothetical protein
MLLAPPRSEHIDDSGNSYYFNNESQESSWEHPLDDYFKNLYERHKVLKTQVSVRLVCRQPYCGDVR